MSLAERRLQSNTFIPYWIPPRLGPNLSQVRRWPGIFEPGSVYSSDAREKILRVLYVPAFGANPVVYQSALYLFGLHCPQERNATASIALAFDALL